jgi:hypothetical protein
VQSKVATWDQADMVVVVVAIAINFFYNKV